MNTKPVIAAFDFDGTITYCDTLMFFLYYTCASPLTWVFKMSLLIPSFFQYLVGSISRKQAKEAILKKFLKNKKIEKIEEAGKQFATSQCLSLLVRASAIKKIAWHQQQGHRCILVSATIDSYLIPWAKKMGFSEVLSSKLDISSGIATGKLSGENCWGPQKAKEVLKLLGLRETFTLYAYGDTLGDRELLALADYPYYRTF